MGKVYVLSEERNGINVLSLLGEKKAKEKMKVSSVIKNITREIKSPMDLINGEPFGGIDYYFASEESECSAIRSFFGDAYPYGERYAECDDYGFPEVCQHFADGGYRKVGAFR